MKKIFLSIMLALTGLAAQAQLTGAKPAPQGLCQPTNKQVFLAPFDGQSSTCPGNTGDLTKFITYKKSIPAGYMVPPLGSEYRFFDNNTHTGQPVTANQVGAGTYYAFAYNPATGCYNTDLSTSYKTIYCCNVPNASVPLLTNSVQIPCFASAVPDLNAYLAPYNLPPNVTVIWALNSTADIQGSNLNLVNPLNAPPGKYYAFFKDTSESFCLYQDASNNGTPFTITKANCGHDTKLPPQDASQWINNVEFDENSKFTLFPNPVTDELSFKDSESLKNIAKTTLYNTQGVEVYQSGAKPSQKINVKHLPTGTYVLRIVEKNNAVSNQRILIAR